MCQLAKTHIWGSALWGSEGHLWWGLCGSWKLLCMYFCIVSLIDSSTFFSPFTQLGKYFHLSWEQRTREQVEWLLRCPCPGGFKERRTRTWGQAFRHYFPRGGLANEGLLSHPIAPNCKLPYKRTSGRWEIDSGRGRRSLARNFSPQFGVRLPKGAQSHDCPMSTVSAQLRVIRECTAHLGTNVGKDQYWELS